MARLDEVGLSALASACASAETVARWRAKIVRVEGSSCAWWTGAVSGRGLIAVCAGHGPSIGIYAERLLDDPLPWTRMRSVYRLQGLVSSYGPDPVETACSRALDLDVVSVSKIAAMLAKATEQQQPQLPAAAGNGHHTGGGRFVRDPGEYARGSSAPTRTTPTSVQLTVIPGGQPADSEGAQP